MTNILTGTPLEAAIAPKIGFAGSSSVMSFIMEGCAAGATLEHTWTIEGYLKGVFDNAQSAMSFEGTPSSSTATITGGNPLALYGKTKVETAAGEALFLAP